MKIIFDINHPCDINFFKNLLNILKKDSKNEIYIVALKRHPIPKILNYEFADFNIKFIGIHRNNILSIIFEANIIKFIRLFYYILKIKPDIGISFGSFLLGIVMKIINKPNIQFYDDPENKKNKKLQKLTATELYYPFFHKEYKIKNFNALKEWAYLSPTYFTPNRDALLQYNLNPKEYFFIREVSTSSLNYTDQRSNLIASISHLLPKNFKILLSLEDKSTINLYPKDWILLQEPVDDIHSLIYYSRLLISSGDSMAREGAMLKVPSIYCGIRDMAANKVMIDKGIFFHININDVPEFVNKIINEELLLEDQKSFRNKLNEEWIDVPEFICSIIEKYKK